MGAIGRLRVAPWSAGQARARHPLPARLLVQAGLRPATVVSFSIRPVRQAAHGYDRTLDNVVRPSRYTSSHPGRGHSVDTNERTCPVFSKYTPLALLIAAVIVAALLGDGGSGLPPF